MQDTASGKSILAITYTDGARAAAVMRRMVDVLSTGGARCAGFIQRDEPSAVGRIKCDMILECLASGDRVKISEDRGPLARGCRLDADALAQTIVATLTAIQDRPDVLVINKFGKTEAEGGGFRTLVADALELGIPVLIAVPWRNVENWRLFAGDQAIEVAADSLRPEEAASALEAIGLPVRARFPSPTAGCSGHPDQGSLLLSDGAQQEPSPPRAGG